MSIERRPASCPRAPGNDAPRPAPRSKRRGATSSSPARPCARPISSACPARTWPWSWASARPPSRAWTSVRSTPRARRASWPCCSCASSAAWTPCWAGRRRRRGSGCTPRTATWEASPPSESAPSPGWSMPSSIWTRCAGRSSLRPLSGRAWRVVESQHLFSTRKLVDSDEEQALLEELIEDVKPPTGAPAGLHYLLFTPFRYPPLRHGSRFGTRAEHGTWYGSRTHATAFPHKQSYLLLYLEGTTAELTPLETDVSIFQAPDETRRGGGLARGPLPPDPG